MKKEISFILAIIIIYIILNLFLTLFGYANGDINTDYFIGVLLIFNLLASTSIILAYINQKRKRYKIKIKIFLIIFLIILSCGCLEKESKEKENLPPSLIIEYPHNEEWVGWSVPIQWAASDPENETITFDIYYGKNDNWNIIIRNLTNKTQYNWDTSNVENNGWILRIIASDGINIVSEEINITVHRDSYGFYLERPQIGEIFTTECNITWECFITPRRSSSNDVSIFYSNDNGSNWNFIVDGYPLSSGRYTYLWNITELVSSKYYQIKLHSDSKYRFVRDYISDYFEIRN